MSLEILSTFCQSIEDELDYRIDWVLPDGDIITAASWHADTGITIGTGPKSPNFTPTSTTVWLSGGLESASYVVTVNVSTQLGRTIQRSFKVKITGRQTT